MPAHENTKPIQVVERMMTILDLIAQNREPMSLHMIAQAANLHPSTVHRLLWNLADYGYLTRNSNGSWKLGLRFLEYGCLVRDRLVIGEVALPIMQELYKITGQTINLAVRHDDNMIYIEHVYSPQRGARLARQIGALAPLHCTSGGKLFLCDCSPEEVRSYINRTQLAARTQFSISSPEKLILELNRVKELGWAEDNEELEYGIHCIGAAIRDKDGRAIASITVASVNGMGKKPVWVLELSKAAQEISAKIAGMKRPLRALSAETDSRV